MYSVKNSVWSHDMENLSLNVNDFKIERSKLRL